MSKLDEELDAFISKAEKAHDLINLLQSEDSSVVQNTQKEIDHILKNDWEEDEYETRDGFSKSQISKSTENVGLGDTPQFHGDQEGFMRAVQEDADRRAANRKKREEKSKIRKEKGNAAFAKGEYREAIDEYDIAINLTGWNVNLYTNKAQALIKLGDYDKAIAACDEALYIEDNFTKGYIQKSNALLAKQCYDDAVACLQTCLESCKDSKSIVEKYLRNAENLASYEADNKDILGSAGSELRKEFEHLIEKMESDKTFEATIASEFVMKTLNNSGDNCRLFRALGGMKGCFSQLMLTSNEGLIFNLLDIAHLALSQDMILLHCLPLLHPTWSEALIRNTPNSEAYRKRLLVFLQKLLYHDDKKVPSTFVSYWTDSHLTHFVVDSFDTHSTRPMCLLVLAQLFQDNLFISRFKDNTLGILKTMSATLLRVDLKTAFKDSKTWLAALSAFSMSQLARMKLDEAFWTRFTDIVDVLVDADSGSILNDLLITGQNFALDSTYLSKIGEDVTKCLLKLFGPEGSSIYPAAPLLLNKVLGKCPSTLLAEDKRFFGAILKVIKSNSTNLNTDVNTAVKLLTRTTAASQQACKWVVKYNILDVLLTMLSSYDVTQQTDKEVTAIMSNAALCCAHCFTDARVCKKQDVTVVDMFLRHAKADKGLAIQQNAAIAIARLATNNPLLLNRLREVNGLEVLHSRFQV